MESFQIIKEAIQLGRRRDLLFMETGDGNRSFKDHLSRSGDLEKKNLFVKFCSAGHHANHPTKSMSVSIDSLFFYFLLFDLTETETEARVLQDLKKYAIQTDCPSRRLIEAKDGGKVYYNGEARKRTGQNKSRGESSFKLDITT